MTDLANAEQHRLLPTRRLGDTLIVTPAGSLAGYGVGEVNREMSQLTRLLDEPGIESLIIDLHGADYFGSEMVGMFVRLQQACRGVTALVGVNHGMRKVFDVMRLEELFSFYGTRRQALKAISSIPLHQRLHAQFSSIPFPARIAVTICTLLVVFWFGRSSNAFYRIIGSPIARDYCTLNDLWSEFSQMERSARSVEEELAIRNELNRSLERLEGRIAMRQSVLGQGASDERNIQEALKYCKRIFDHGEDSIDRIVFMHHMHCTRNSIARRTGLELPMLQSADEA